MIQRKEKEAERILLINDIAGYGKISLGAMIPIMSHMGFNIYNLPTAVVSNTLDYGIFEILDTTEYMKNTLKVWEQLGFEFDAVCTGLILSEEQAKLISRYCREQQQQGKHVFVDPIMGDDGKLYNGVSHDTVVHMRHLCSVADIIMPNFTEAAFLADMYQDKSSVTETEIKQIVDALRNMGSKSVIITSVNLDGNSCVFGYDQEKGEYFTIPYEHVPVHFAGTGDMFSALLVGGVLKGKELQEATAYSMEMVRRLILRNADNADKNKGIPIEKYLDEMTNF